MAVVNTKSTTLSNEEASPKVFIDPRVKGGRIRVLKETLEVAAADDDNSTYRFFRVRSNWSINSIKVFSDAITGGTDWDCGLYAIDDGAAVDADCYADGVSLAVLSITGTEIRFADTTTADIALLKQKVWEDAGLSADPEVEYDLVLTANTVGSAAGTISLIVEYTAGD